MPRRSSSRSDWVDPGPFTGPGRSTTTCASISRWPTSGWLHPLRRRARAHRHWRGSVSASAGRRAVWLVNGSSTSTDAHPRLPSPCPTRSRRRRWTSTRSRRRPAARSHLGPLPLERLRLRPPLVPRLRPAGRRRSKGQIPAVAAPGEIVVLDLLPVDGRRSRRDEARAATSGNQGRGHLAISATSPVRGRVPLSAAGQ